jgi:cell wall-associated NlpC family hydrolase
MRKYGNPRDALAVYNSGRPWATSQRFAETKNYVTKILGGLGNVTATTGQTVGGSRPPQAPAPTVGFQSPGPNPQSLADLRAYMAASEQSVLGGAPAPDADATIQRIAKRRATAPPQVGRQVATDALQNLGGAAMPGGEFQGIASDGAQTAIQAASQRVGTPYSWGGGTPSGPGRGFGRGANTVGFDCSSLVQYAWAKAGVKLPRTTYDQIKVGKPVGSVAQARPGDLMFPHPGHVVMYVGNGKVVEAPFTGGRVRIVPAKSRYLAIRRPA